MNISMLKGKIHRATVKQAELDYVGSITVDPVLLEAAGILEYEHVHIVDVNNGSRFETYTIPGEYRRCEQRKPFRDIYNSRRARKWDDLLKRTCSTLRGNRR